MKRAIMSVVVFLSLAECSSEAMATPVNPNSVVVDNIAYYIQTDKAVYNLTENVEMLYRVTNLTENPVDIGEVLKGDCWANFLITDQADVDIWQYVREIPPCDWEMLHLEPYESKELQITWDMISDNGTFFDHDDDYPVGPGLYNITGELTLSASYERVPVSVSIGIIPEPATIFLLAVGAIIEIRRWQTL